MRSGNVHFMCSNRLRPRAQAEQAPLVLKRRGRPPQSRRPLWEEVGLLAFDGDGARLFELGLLDLLGNRDLQRAVVELRLDVGFLDVFADVELAAALAGETLAAQVGAGVSPRFRSRSWRLSSARLP